MAAFMSTTCCTEIPCQNAKKLEGRSSVSSHDCCRQFDSICFLLIWNTNEGHRGLRTGLIYFWLRLGSCVVNVRIWCRWGYLICWEKLISFSCSFDPMNLYNNRSLSENYEPVHSLRRPTFVIQKRNSPEGRVIHGASCQSSLRPHHPKIEAPTAASSCWTVTTTNNSAILRTTLSFMWSGNINWRLRTRANSF